MKEKIENRLKVLYEELSYLNEDRAWIRTTGGLTRSERINKCQLLIEELESLLKIS